MRFQLISTGSLWQIWPYNSYRIASQPSALKVLSSLFLLIVFILFLIFFILFLCRRFSSPEPKVHTSAYGISRNQSSVRLTSVRQYFQTTFPLKLWCSLLPNFIYNIYRQGNQQHFFSSSKSLLNFGCIITYTFYWLVWENWKFDLLLCHYRYLHRTVTEFL